MRRLARVFGHRKMEYVKYDGSGQKIYGYLCMYGLTSSLQANGTKSTSFQLHAKGTKSTSFQLHAKGTKSTSFQLHAKGTKSTSFHLHAYRTKLTCEDGSSMSHPYHMSLSLYSYLMSF